MCMTDSTAKRENLPRSRKEAEESVHAGESVDIFFVLSTIGNVIGD